jgi:polyhydroxyalkanoate synthesis regulator phasin
VIVVTFVLLLLTVGGGAFTLNATRLPTKSESKLQHDPSKRAEAELSRAEAAFDNAREAYTKGDVDKGDADLEDMTKALDACLESLQAAHKARFYKKAELRVANLQRRMSSLLDDIDLPQRGWAEQTNRKLDEIHDKLLTGAMNK